MYVVPPGVDFQPEQYRVLDFAAYYRFVKARLERAIEQNRNGITTSSRANCALRDMPLVARVRRGMAEAGLVSGGKV